MALIVTLASKSLTGLMLHSLRKLNWPDVTLVSEDLTGLMLH